VIVRSCVTVRRRSVYSAMSTRRQLAFPSIPSLPPSLWSRSGRSADLAVPRARIRGIGGSEAVRPPGRYCGGWPCGNRIWLVCLPKGRRRQTLARRVHGRGTARKRKQTRRNRQADDECVTVTRSMQTSTDPAYGPGRTQEHSPPYCTRRARYRVRPAAGNRGPETDRVLEMCQGAG